MCIYSRIYAQGFIWKTIIESQRLAESKLNLLIPFSTQWLFVGEVERSTDQYSPSSAYPNTIGEGVLKSLEAYWIKAYCDLREVDELYIGRVTGGEESIIDLAHQAHEIETRILLMARPLLSVIN